jgi:transposase-like protein
MIDFKGSHFEKEIILWGVRWYVAYPLSYRPVRSDEAGARRGRRSLYAQPLGPQVCPGV